MTTQRLSGGRAGGQHRTCALAPGTGAAGVGLSAKAGPGAGAAGAGDVGLTADDRPRVGDAGVGLSSDEGPGAGAAGVGLSTDKNEEQVAQASGTGVAPYSGNPSWVGTRKLISLAVRFDYRLRESRRERAGRQSLPSPFSEPNYPRHPGLSAPSVTPPGPSSSSVSPQTASSPLSTEVPIKLGRMRLTPAERQCVPSRAGVSNLGHTAP